MSQLIAVTSGLSAGSWISPDDPNNRMRPNWFVRPDHYWRPDDWAIRDFYESGWWPGASGLSTDAGGAFGGIISVIQWEQPEKISGQSSRLGLTGTTRDVYGSPLGGVTVKVFRTADDTLQGSTISDVNNGTYLVTTPFNDGHYIVARKDGSPDVFGATDNDLLGA
jgi:hypothetical protein